MSAARTGRKSRKKGSEPGTNWKRVHALTAAQVRAALRRDPEVEPTGDAFWAAAKVVMPRPKQTVTMRLDADLLEWFRTRRGYQTRINAILRSHMDSQAHRH